MEVNGNGGEVNEVAGKSIKGRRDDETTAGGRENMGHGHFGQGPAAIYIYTQTQL
jgi:hypothetical protein